MTTAVAVADATKFYQRALFAAMRARKQAVQDGDTEMRVILDERIAYTKDCIKAVQFVGKTGMSPVDAFAFYGINIKQGGRL
jgi:hypothetical protein